MEQASDAPIPSIMNSQDSFLYMKEGVGEIKQKKVQEHLEDCQEKSDGTWIQAL